MSREEWLDVGCSTHPGWAPLLRALDSELRVHWPNYTIAQIKEKFGTLRFYASPGLAIPAFDDSGDADEAYRHWHARHIAPFDALIHAYEAKSAKVCELCGEPGTLGDRHYWWATRCTDCAPEGWVSSESTCEHPTIENDTCIDCGRTRIARLEHSDVVLSRVHPAGTCVGEFCTIHHRSDHRMRAFPQQWRADRGFMERRCPHGVGHPDPDEYLVHGVNGPTFAMHGCDGCCQEAS